MPRKKLEISSQLLDEIKRDADNLAKAKKLFENFDSRLNQVGKYLDKVPANSTVKPKKFWLSIFGIE